MPETDSRLRGQRVWLIDRREYWRRPFTRALTEAGLKVLSTDRYTYPPFPLQGGSRSPDLVILACTAVTADELRLVRAVSRCRHDLLVLAASLPSEVMRELFRAGAYDVTKMPVRPDELVALVLETLKDSASAREHKAAALAGL